MRYFYRVSAGNVDGRSVPSEVESIVNRPSGPTNVEVTSYRTDRLVLDWRDVSGDAGYRIERSLDGSTWTAVGTVGVNVPSYTNTSLATGTVYSYRVVPLSPLGDGVASGIAVGSTRLATVTGLTVTATTSTSVALSWTAVAGANQYRVERSADGVTFTSIANTSGTSFTNNGLTALTEYYYRVIGVNSLTESGAASATAFAATQAPQPLPIPWSTADVGSVGGPGAAGLSGSTFTMLGSGSTIGGSADGFRFVYQPLTGDGTITARVATQENTANGARAGVMIREALTAGSKSALMAVTPASGALFVRRTTTGGSSSTTTTASLAAPYWVRLARVGGTVTGYVSPDGVTWTQAGTATVGMTATVYVGLAVSSADNTELNRSTLDSVTVTRTAPPTQVQSVAVNDGADQRSQVTSLTVTFGSTVTLPANAADAFRLSRVGGGDVPLMVDLSQSTATQTVARLTFSGSLTEGGSLMDGRYQLTVRGGVVYNGFGFVDGDADGTAGGDYVSPADELGGTGLRLYRLFGDATGDGVVDLADLGQMRGTFNAGVGEPAYLAYLDADANGTVDLSDLGQFRSRFNQNLFP
jgi:regulation of enolase protein 1 (concanavalin A-like superfamily)